MKKLFLIFLFCLIASPVFAADRYWVGGGSSTNWNATGDTNWSASSGGTGNASVPGSSDDVHLDANSGSGSSIVSANASINSLDCTGFTGTLEISAWRNLIIQDADASSNALILSSGMTLTMSASSTYIQISGANTTKVTTNGKVIRALYFSTYGGERQLQDDLHISSTLLTYAGTTLDANSHDVILSSGSSQSIIGPFTFYNLTKVATSKNEFVSFSADQTISNILAFSGDSATNRLLVNSSLLGTARTITAATVTVTNADFRDITGAGAGSWDLSSVSGGSGDCLGNTDITFTTADELYWVGGTGNWSDTAEWSTSSGGAGGARVPLPQDNVNFDSNSFSAGSQTVTVDMARMGADITWTGATNSPTLAYGAVTTAIYGSVTYISAMSVTHNSPKIWFYGRGTETITSAGNSWNNSYIYINMPGGTWQLADAFTTTLRGFTHYRGTIDTNTNNVLLTSYQINISSSGTRALNIDSVGWTITCNHGTSAMDARTLTNLTITALPLMTFTRAGGAYTLSSGLTWSSTDITLADRNAVTSTFTWNDGGTFKDFVIGNGRTVAFENNTTLTVNSFNSNGDASYNVALTCSGTGFDLTDSGGTGTNTASYTDLTNIEAQADGATWDATDNCTDSGNNGEWDFVGAGAARRMFVVD